MSDRMAAREVRSTPNDISCTAKVPTYLRYGAVTDAVKKDDGTSLRYLSCLSCLSMLLAPHMYLYRGTCSLFRVIAVWETTMVPMPAKVTP